MQSEHISEIILFQDVGVSLSTYCRCFDANTGIFLELIEVTGSMSAACRAMHMSYTKGWNMINNLESVLRIKLLKCNVGGSSGGGSSLTDEGMDFLRKYQEASSRIKESARNTFDELFAKYI